MNIFICGIAGRTGRQTVVHLVARGDSVSGLCRSHEQATAIEGLGAQTRIGDLTTISVSTLAEAMRGAEAIVFAAGAGENDADAFFDAVVLRGLQKAMAAAHLGGIARLLLVSVFPEAWRGGDAPPSFEHYLRVKKKADVALAHSLLDWIILRPSSLTDDPGTGKITLSAAEIHTTISRVDVAATIVALLHAPGVHQRVLEVTGGTVPIEAAVDALLYRGSSMTLPP